MGMEFEWKFLVKNDSWRRHATALLIRQGYMKSDSGTVRFRIYGENAYITIKGPTHGNSRLEFEYPIPVEDAHVLLDQFCHKPLIEKIRHEVMHKGTKWVIDEFLGENKGLIVAELELESEVLAYDPPDWLGPNVSDDPRYYNSNLVAFPFRLWKENVQPGLT